MKNESLGLYLNDHRAGSVAALELLDHLIRTYEGRPIAAFCRDMKNEIEADQQVLREVIRSLGVEESTLRKATAWVAEKLSRAKLALEEEKTGDVGLVQALEGLVLGIKGKQVLWSALARMQTMWPELKAFAFTPLEQRALEQGARVDGMRLKAANEAFQPSAST